MVCIRTRAERETFPNRVAQLSSDYWLSFALALAGTLIQPSSHMPEPTAELPPPMRLPVARASRSANSHQQKDRTPTQPCAWMACCSHGKDSEGGEPACCLNQRLAGGSSKAGGQGIALPSSRRLVTLL